MEMKLPLVWILVFTNLEQGSGDDFCTNTCKCTEVNYLFSVGGIESLSCTNVPVQDISNYIETLPSKMNDCSYLTISNSVVAIIDRNTFFIRYGHHLESLVLTNTSIQIIPSNAFTNLNLKKLDVSHNSIKHIDFIHIHSLEKLDVGFNIIDNLNNNTFYYSQNLKALYLDHNLLQTLSRNTFIGIKTLLILWLDHNTISIIEPETFTGLNTLKILNLNCNNLNAIPENLFENLNDLDTLDLSSNKISALNSNSFSGLYNLRNLLLTNNKIKELPLGTLRSPVLLENLQLGENGISAFQTGSFSSLERLKHLNISNNNIFKLGETVLFPLGSLEILVVNNNSLIYMNYNTLLAHLPNLHFVNVGGNNWTCKLLGDMLRAFRTRNVDYLFNTTKIHTENNVKGIFCTESYEVNFREDNDNYAILNKPYQNTDVLMPFIQNMSAILSDMSSVQLNGSSFRKDNYDQLQNALENISAIFVASNSVNVYTNLYVTHIFILLALISIVILLFIIVYKKNYQKFNARSDIQLLSELT